MRPEVKLKFRVIQEIQRLRSEAEVGNSEAKWYSNSFEAENEAEI
jgi:hypothetical protein